MLSLHRDLCAIQMWHIVPEVSRQKTAPQYDTLTRKENCQGRQGSLSYSPSSCQRSCWPRQFSLGLNISICGSFLPTDMRHSVTHLDFTCKAILVSAQ